ncbi:transposase zinc-binding domain-containing protein, partial [Thiotrichales bacterium 19X7-9]|nr:transposase zinc-binding domain-containing protein [Thiotrichales bacterium 19X7-9]
MRPVVVENVIKLMSCGLRVRGFKTYCCSNNQCTHTKTVTFGCKSRFCPTCGKKATDIWINKQQNIMPKIPFQHITFTMPDKLWPLFKEDPKLLNQLPKLAADVIQKIAKNRNIKVGIFVAVHTFGRDLQWHVHIHLSVSMAGLTSKRQYKEIKFSKKQVEPMWRYRVIKLFKAARVNKTINVTNAFLELQYFK